MSSEKKNKYINYKLRTSKILPCSRLLALCIFLISIYPNIYLSFSPSLCINLSCFIFPPYLHLSLSTIFLKELISILYDGTRTDSSIFSHYWKRFEFWDNYYSNPNILQRTFLDIFIKVVCTTSGSGHIGFLDAIPKVHWVPSRGHLQHGAPRRHGLVKNSYCLYKQSKILTMHQLILNEK